MHPAADSYPLLRQDSKFCMILVHLFFALLSLYFPYLPRFLASTRANTATTIRRTTKNLAILISRNPEMSDCPHGYALKEYSGVDRTKWCQIISRFLSLTKRMPRTRWIVSNTAPHLIIVCNYRSVTGMQRYRWLHRLTYYYELLDSCELKDNHGQ